MVGKNRKEREKDQFGQLVIKAAYELVKSGGVEGLTLRKLAARLEYSTFKLLGQMQDAPAAFKRASERFMGYVAALKLSKEALDDGLNVIRVLNLGALSLLRPGSSECKKEFVVKIINDGMRLLIAAWKTVRA